MLNIKTLPLLCLMLTLASEVLARGYYTRDVECRNTGRRAVEGGVVGGLFGLAGDILLRGRPGALTVGGTILGAGVGAASSCEEVVRYHSDVDRYLDDTSRRGHYRIRGGGTEILDRGYSYNGKYCVEHQSYFFNRRGRAVWGEVTTSCRMRYGWKHYPGERLIYSKAPPRYRYDSHPPERSHRYQSDRYYADDDRHYQYNRYYSGRYDRGAH